MNYLIKFVLMQSFKLRDNIYTYKDSKLIAYKFGKSFASRWKVYKFDCYSRNKKNALIYIMLVSYLFYSLF